MDILLINSHQSPSSYSAEKLRQALEGKSAGEHAGRPPEPPAHASLGSLLPRSFSDS